MFELRSGALAALLLSATVFVAACGDDEEEASGGESGGTETITYAQPTPPTLLFYPPIVAEELGFFDEEGVEAEAAPAAEEIPMTAFIQNGDADLALADLDEVLIGRARGGDFEVVFNPQPHATEGTVVPADSPIQSFDELAGTQVGLASEENTAIFEAQLQAGGVDPGEIETTIVGTSGPTVAQALENGDIDGYVGAVSDFTALQANGIELRNITPPELADLPGNPMMTSPAIIEENGEGIERFLRAWAMGQYVGLERPDVVEAIVREAVPEEWRNEAVGEAALEQAIALYEHEDPEQLGGLDPAIWETGQDLLLEVGILEEEVDITPVLNDQFIEAANDWDREEVLQRADEYAQENGI